MKKLLLVAFAGLFFTAGTNAQVQRKMPQHQGIKSDSSHHFQKGEMMAQLNLTPDQKTQMKALRENMQQQRNAIQNDASLTAVQKKEKMNALHKDRNKQNKMNQPQQS